MNHLIQYIKNFVIVFYVCTSRLVKLGDFAEYLSEISYLLLVSMSLPINHLPYLEGLKFQTLEGLKFQNKRTQKQMIQA